MRKILWIVVDCENLKKVVLEEGLRSIEDWAFFNCVNMRELTIPESVVTIEQKSVESWRFESIRIRKKQHTG